MKYSNTTGHAVWEILTDYCYCAENHQLEGKKKKEGAGGEEKWKREEPKFSSDQKVTP